MKVAFEMKLVAKGTDRVFDEELGPGILASQIVEFEIKTILDLDSPMFAVAVLDAEDDLRDRLVEVQTRRINDSSKSEPPAPCKNCGAPDPRSPREHAINCSEYR